MSPNTDEAPVIFDTERARRPSSYLIWWVLLLRVTVCSILRTTSLLVALFLLGRFAGSIDPPHVSSSTKKILVFKVRHSGPSKQLAG